MRRYLPVVFWWPRLGRFRDALRLEWDWCLPQRDHWHLGPIGIYYTGALEEAARVRTDAELAEID